LISKTSAGTLGVLTYEIIGGTEVSITDCDQNATGVVVVPDEIEGFSVTSIDDSTFSNCTNITSVTLPATVNEIGARAFFSCTGLTSIDLPIGVTIIKINTFYNCISLANVTLPMGFLEIEDRAFDNCDSLVNITIPASVTSIHYHAFKATSSLLNINVDTANTTYSSLNGVLFSNDLAEILTYPSGRSGTYTIPPGVTVIGEYCFSYCQQTTEVTIPNTVNEIGWRGFHFCSALLAITVDPSNTVFSSLDGVLFNEAQTLIIAYPGGKTGIYNIPSEVEAVGNSAFNGCQFLSGITLPDSLITIDKAAFSLCTALVSIEIPDSVTYIGSSAFLGCNSLKTVNLSEGLTSIGFRCFMTCGNLETINIPSGITAIEWQAFSHCFKLKQIVFPSNLSNIGDRAFYQCFLLEEAFFLGNAPIFGNQAITTGSGTREKLTILFYLSSSNGFTSPIWNGYETRVINETTYPSASWLLSNNINYETPMDQDLNGDGVSLETAQALDLDPNKHLSGKLPTALLVGNTLSIEFYGVTPGYEYKVFTSTDMLTWSEAGVTISAPDAEGMRTATTPTTGDAKFLRLSVARETP